MPKTDPRVDAYIARSAEPFRPILTHLRELVHAACPEVEEAWKWSFPCFMYKGILCGMAAFKSHCTFGFLNKQMRTWMSAETSDAAMGQFGKILSRADLPPDHKLIGYIKQAMKFHDQPKEKKPPKLRQAKLLTVPDYLRKALKSNAKALATFERFPISQRNEYVEWLTEAKRPETRTQRLATTIQWLSEGKIRNWKYVPKGK